MLVELVQHNLGLRAALQFNDDAHALAVGFVADVADVVHGLVVDQVGNSLDQGRLVHLVRDLGDDDRLAFLADVLNGGAGAHQKTAAAVFVSGANSLLAVNEAGGREVGALHVLEHVVERGVRIVHQLDAGVHDLRQVVRRNVGCHAHGNAVRAVYQQVGNARGQHDGLGGGVVEVLDKIHRVLVDVRQQFLGNGGHAAFGVAVGRGRVAIDGAEVALAIHQRIAQ